MGGEYSGEFERRNASRKQRCDKHSKRARKYSKRTRKYSECCEKTEAGIFFAEDEDGANDEDAMARVLYLNGIAAGVEPGENLDDDIDENGDFIGNNEDNQDGEYFL
jgi:hypothetical protein